MTDPPTPPPGHPHDHGHEHGHGRAGGLLSRIRGLVARRTAAFIDADPGAEEQHEPTAHPTSGRS